MKDLQSERDFRFQKTIDIQDKKKHNPDGPGGISEMSESSEQRSESTLEIALKKNTNVCSNYLVCKQTRSQRVILLVLLERKVLDEKPNSLSTGAS